MKKRILIWLLVLAMAGSLLPAGVFAADAAPAESAEAEASEPPAETPAPLLQFRARNLEDAVYALTVSLSPAELGGSVVFALYGETGQQTQLQTFPAAEVVSASFEPVQAGDVVKVFWLDAESRPVTVALKTVAEPAADADSPVNLDHLAEGTLVFQGNSFDEPYLDNEITLAAADGVSRAEIEALAARIQGVIVDEIPLVGHYQVQLDCARSAQELSDLVAQLQSDPLLDGAYFVTVGELGSQSAATPIYPSGGWNDGDFIWNEGYPQNEKWGWEAIYVPSAWGLLAEHKGLNHLPKVKIGVIDSMFDQSHEDLTFQACWGWSAGAWAPLLTDHTAEYAMTVNPYDKENKITEYYGNIIHGSHVAGIIAADHNGKGIDGIAVNSELYGVSMMMTQIGGLKLERTQKMLMPLHHMEKALSLLIEAGTSNNTVINYSQWDALNSANDRAAIVDLLTKYLRNGYDFVITTSAGNADNRDTLNNNIFTAITDTRIKNRIIVVGAAKPYDVETATFSFLSKTDSSIYNYGKRIDLAAPGVDIYSTVPKGTKIGAAGYYSASGTSAAAPHVAGVAALVWEADAALSGAQVKKIILDTANIPLQEDDGSGNLIPSTDAKGNYHSMVNAAAAVAKALDVEFELGGKCGDQLTWSLKDGTLTIAGQGAMQDYEPEQLPWARYKNEVTKLILADGVTSICAGAFYNFRSLTEISDFPETLRSIGAGAFYNVGVKEFAFSGSAPTKVSGAAEGEDASFAYRGDPAAVTLYYPAEQTETWDADGDEKWEGYTALPSAVTVTGVLYRSDTCDALTEQAFTLSAEGLKKSYAAATDNTGHFKVTLTETAPEGILKWKVTAANFDPQTVQAEPQNSVCSLGSLYLKPLFRLTITVEDEDGNPVEDARITAEGLEESLTTNAAGEAEARLPQGDYTFTAAKGGKYVTSSVTLNDDADLTMKFPASHMEWSLDDNGVLRITGWGPMPDYKAKNYLTTAPWGSYENKIKEVIINGPTTIGRYAFYRCSYINSVEISNTVASIGQYAFSGCTSLINIQIPDSVTIIESYAFASSGLTSINIPESINTISYNTFYYCTKLTSISIPSSVTQIGSNVFTGCNALKAIYISDIEAWCHIQFNITPVINSDWIYYDSQTLPSDWSLYLNNNLITNLSIPDTITSIGAYSFYGCTSLEYVTIPNSVYEIGFNAFQRCTNLKSISMENSVVKTIKADAFNGCTNLKSVTFSVCLLEIGQCAFENCTSLSNLQIPYLVTTIKENTFLNCTSLNSITISNKVAKISEKAFWNCKNLAYIDYSGTDKQWNNISVASNNDAWTSATPRYEYDGYPISCGSINQFYSKSHISWTLNKNYELVINGKGEMKDSSQPWNNYRDSIKCVTIKSDITAIGDSMFENCISLTSIIIPDSVTNIGKSAFRGCSSLTSITIPNSVTSIGNDVFSDCSSLTSVSIEAGVTSIGNYAFSDCSSLTSIRFQSENYPTIGARCFTNVTATAYYPSSWGSAPNDSYGGNITWVAYDPA